jgi:hypothetical protein
VPAYLVAHTKNQRGDMLIEDETLTLEVTSQWAIFTDQHGIVLALPAEHVASIQRVDEPQELAPQKE